MSTITCHGYAGQLWFKNVQCPGSSSCCGDVTECTPQRLCKKSNGQLVRASCAEKDWDLSVCAQICLYDNNDFLPRVTQCADGTYCCDNDANCCANGQGVKLDDRGQAVGPTSRISSSASSTSPTTNPIKTPTVDSDGASSSANPSTLPVEAVSSELSTGAKAGIGVGVSLGVLALAAILFFVFWRRRRQDRPKSTSESAELDAPSYEAGYSDQNPQSHVSGMHMDGMQGGSAGGIVEHYKPPEELASAEVMELGVGQHMVGGADGKFGGVGGENQVWELDGGSAVGSWADVKR